MARKRTPIRYSGKTYSSYAALAREYDINPSTLATTRQRIKKENKSLSQTQVLERAMVSILKKQIQAVDSGDLLVEIKQLKKELHEVKDRLNIVESEMNQSKAQKDAPENIKNAPNNKSGAKEKALKTPKNASESNIKEEHSEHHLTPAERNAQRHQEKQQAEQQEVKEQQPKTQTTAQPKNYLGFPLIDMLVGLTPEDKALRINLFHKSAAEGVEKWKAGDASIKSLGIPYADNKMPKDNFIIINAAFDDPNASYKDALKWEQFTSKKKKTRYGLTFDESKLSKENPKLPDRVLSRIRNANALSEEEYAQEKNRDQKLKDFKIPEFL